LLWIASWEEQNDRKKEKEEGFHKGCGYFKFTREAYTKPPGLIEAGRLFFCEMAALTEVLLLALHMVGEQEFVGMLSFP